MSSSVELLIFVRDKIEKSSVDLNTLYYGVPESGDEVETVGVTRGMYDDRLFVVPINHTLNRSAEALCYPLLTTEANDEGHLVDARSVSCFRRVDLTLHSFNLPNFN